MTRTFFRTAAALALLSTGQLAQAATAKPCISQPELRGMVAYIMPSVMSSVIERCRASLPAGSAMLTRGTQVVTELQAGQSAAFPMARQAFAKFSDDGNKDGADLFQSMPEDTLKPIIESAITKELTASVTVKDCPDIDRVFGTLQPLPASNFVDLITQVMTIATRDNKQMSVCAA